MLALFRNIEKGLDEWAASDAPYGQDGANSPTDVHETRERYWLDLVKKPGFTLKDIPAYLDALEHTSSINDRELLLEKVLVLMSRLDPWPSKSGSVGLQDFSRKIQRQAILLLYNDLPHPPSSYLAVYDATQATKNPTIPTVLSGKSLTYAFRSADGSCYNPLFPSLGKAGSPYARSVPALKTVPKSILPDAGLVFDELLRRKEFVPHPSGISSLFFAFANLVIHSLFNTDHHDGTTNKSSSYLDLSILYGSSEAQVNSVRKKDGSGKLHEDVFADSRLLLMPPSTCALLVLLNRNHNYIAQKLLEINENGNFSPNPEAENLLAQDDEIFHRSRLVNCGYFMKIILGDYVGAILGLVRDGSPWRLDTLMETRELDHSVSPRGAGNVVSFEFNLLYRWHATLSAEDTKWTEGLFRENFPGKHFSDITPKDFYGKAHSLIIPQSDVKEWNFGNLKRYDGRFRDGDLAKILQDATSWSAAAFSSGIPDALRVIEILGIEESRSWGICSMNEFRKFLGLKPFESFAEWNPQPEIYTKAAALYGHIDNLELHVGLQAEACKIPGPGAGLCPGYTISRAILSDAVCLTRGDPYLTTEFTPYNFTTWGYNDCQYDDKDGSYGGMLTKLLFRTLPGHYPAGSAYAHFPFIVPDVMKKNMKVAKDIQNYEWERPALPKPTLAVDFYGGVKQILSEREFMSNYDNRLLTLVKNMAPSDSVIDSRLTEARAKIEKLILDVPPRSYSLEDYFRSRILSLAKEKSFQPVSRKSKYLDIAHDVINLLPVYWICEEILGLPLKTLANQNGTWREQDCYERFAEIGRYIYLNYDSVDDWHLRSDSTETFQKVFDWTRAHCKSFKNQFSILEDRVLPGHSHHFLHSVTEKLGADWTADEIAIYAQASVIPTAALFSQAITLVVKFYLDENRRQERANIAALAASLPQDKKCVDQIMVYINEALQLNPLVPGVYRTAAKDVPIRGFGIVKAQEQVFANIAKATHDEPAFNEQLKSANLMFGLGGHGLLSEPLFRAMVPTIVGTILGLRDIRLSKDPDEFTELFGGDNKRQMYIGTDGKITPFLTSLQVEWD